MDLSIFQSMFFALNLDAFEEFRGMLVFFHGFFKICIILFALNLDAFDEFRSNLEFFRFCCQSIIALAIFETKK